MRRILGFIVGIVAISSVYGQSDLTPGIKLIANENYGEATKFFEKAMSAEPKNGLPIYYLGKIKYALEDFKGAEEMYNKASLLDKKCTLCQIGQLHMMLDNGKTAEADKAAMGIEKASKKSASMLAALGDAYLFSKKPNAARAIALLTKSRDLDPKVGSTWSHLGDAFKLAGEPGNAMSSYEVAVQKDKTNVEALIAMGKIWRASKNYALAEEKLQEAVKLQPDFAPTYKDLYETLIAAKKYDKVLPILDKYVSLSGSDDGAKLRLVKYLAFQAKDYERAIKEALEIKPRVTDYTLNRWLAWSYAELGKFQEGYDASKTLFADIAKNPEKNKSIEQDYYYLAKSAMGLGKEDEALAAYEEYWKTQPDSKEEIYTNLAKTKYDAKDFVNAIKYYNKRNEIKPLSTTEFSYLGLAQFNHKDYAGAEATFTKLVEKSPTYSFGWYYRAYSLHQTDPNQEVYPAIGHYQKFLEVAKADPNPNKTHMLNAYKYIGYGLVKNNDNAGAKAAFEQVVALDPTNADAVKYVEILSKGK
jgi:tetratricopeptide (TPR) repeat protein